MNKKPSLSSAFKLFMDPPSQLGELVVKAGFINESQLEEMAKARQAIPGRLGQMLVMAGYINHKELEDIIQVQCLVREKIVERNTGVQALRLIRQRNIELSEALAMLESQEHAEPSTRLGDLLVEAGIVTREQLEDALASNHSSGLPLGRVLVLSGVLTDQLLVAALNAQMVLRKGAIERKDAIRSISSAAHKPAAATPQPEPIAVREPTPTITLPARESFLEMLLIGAEVIREADFAQAMRTAYEKNSDVGAVLIHLNLIDATTLSMAREMQRLVSEKFLDAQWCVQSLKDAHRERGLKGPAASMTPAGADKETEVPLSADAPNGTKEICLSEFLTLCKVATPEQIERAQTMCAITDLGVGAGLIRTRTVPEVVIDIVERCFKLVSEKELSLEEGVFAFDFCNRQVVEKENRLVEAAEMLGFQSGIWALHDSLAVR
jgi:hypothetical protein